MPAPALRPHLAQPPEWSGSLERGFLAFSILASADWDSPEARGQNPKKYPALRCGAPPCLPCVRELPSLLASAGAGASACLSQGGAMAGAEQKHLTLDEVAQITQQALRASGLSATAAQAITDVVTQAERDECHSHGLFRVPGYCSAVIKGKVNGTAEPVVHDVAPGVVRVDACGGYAPSAILAGRAAAVAKARKSGIACLAIHNSAHFAALWWEVESLARDGIGVASRVRSRQLRLVLLTTACSLHWLAHAVSLAFVNSTSYVAHQGGKRRLYGTNPMGALLAHDSFWASASVFHTQSELCDERSVDNGTNVWVHSKVLVTVRCSVWIPTRSCDVHYWWA